MKMDMADETELGPDGDRSPDRRPHPRRRADGAGWRTAFLAELDRDARRGRWGLALFAVAGLHLAAFGLCQWIYRRDVPRDPRHLLIWMAEVGLSLAAFRLIAGRGWAWGTVATGTIVRIWATFLILTFSVASMNELTGWQLPWFRLAWCTLSSFGFATMAWLIDLRFLIFAFQMYFTSLLIFRYPHQGHAIYAVSWAVVLSTIGLVLERRRSRHGREGS